LLSTNGIAWIIFAVTGNRNRAVAEFRHVLKRSSVSFASFNLLSSLNYYKNASEDDLVLGTLQISLGHTVRDGEVGGSIPPAAYPCRPAMMSLVGLG